MKIYDRFPNSEMSAWTKFARDSSSSLLDSAAMSGGGGFLGKLMTSALSTSGAFDLQKELRKHETYFSLFGDHLRENKPEWYGMLDYFSRSSKETNSGSLSFSDLRNIIESYPGTLPSEPLSIRPELIAITVDGIWTTANYEQELNKIMSFLL